MASRNIFATVGTTQFDLFIGTLTSSTILRLLAAKGYRKLILQIGNGTPPSKMGLVEGIDIEYFQFKDSIAENIRQADLVISHAGAGSCLEVLAAGKPLIVVINEQLMDNHQIELAEQLHEEGHLFYSKCSNLEQTLQNMDLSCLKPFKEGNPKLFVDFLDNIMFGIEK